jgi:hypothetical protein
MDYRFNILAKSWFMFQLKIFFLAVLFSQICVSQNFNLNKGTVQTKDYYSEITFEYVKNKIIIPVVIEGKTYRFILDTGAPNIISQELFQIIKNDSLATIPITDINQKKLDLQVVSIPNLVLGGVIFKNSAALVYNLELNKILDCFQIDGFIGSNMLRNSIVQIQLKNKMLTITNDKKRLHLNRKNATKLKLLGIQSSPFIWMNLYGKGKAKEQVLIDTGMAGFYDMSNKDFKIFHDKDIIQFIDSSKGSYVGGLFGSENKTEQYRSLIPKMKIAKSTFINFVTTTTHDKFSKIGTDILDYGNMTIDYKNKRFYFDSFKKEINLKKKELGFDPAFINDKIVVGFVWNENLKKIISYGDEIIEVNHIIIQDSDLCDLAIKKNIFMNSDKFNLRIKKHNGEIIELVLEKKYFPNTVYLQNK